MITELLKTVFNLKLGVSFWETPCKGISVFFTLHKPGFTYLLIVPFAAGMAADVTSRLHVGDAIISVDGVDLR